MTFLLGYKLLVNEKWYVGGGAGRGDGIEFWWRGNKNLVGELIQVEGISKFFGW